jgi:hypothetical protein
VIRLWLAWAVLWLSDKLAKELNCAAALVATKGEPRWRRRGFSFYRRAGGHAIDAAGSPSEVFSLPALAAAVLSGTG